jgi:hypothetical protein
MYMFVKAAVMSSALHPLKTRSEPSIDGWQLWRRWTLATMLGELIGFVAPALAGVIVVRAATALHQPVAALLTLIVLVVAGGFEGAALGWAQGSVLRRVLPALSLRRFTVATALAAMLAWLLGMLPNTVSDLLGSNMVVLIGLWIAVALPIVLSIGAAQWLVLRRYVPRSALWIPIVAGAWAIGVMATFIGASLITDTMPIAAAVAIGVGSGVLMGLVAGALSGLGLVYILSCEV